MAICFPKVYPILDSSIIPATGRAEFLRRLGGSLAEAGVTLLEYRNKTGGEAELLTDAAILRAAMPVGQVKLVLDDRADLVEQLGFDGVHVDADDLTPAAARRLLGPDRIIGTFGGGAELVPGVLETPADYFSIGVVFPTRTKQVTAPPIGMEGVRRWPLLRPLWKLELRWWRLPGRCSGSRTRRPSSGNGLSCWGK